MTSRSPSADWKALYILFLEDYNCFRVQGINSLTCLLPCIEQQHIYRFLIQTCIVFKLIAPGSTLVLNVVFSTKVTCLFSYTIMSLHLPGGVDFITISKSNCPLSIKVYVKSKPWLHISIAWYYHQLFSLNKSFPCTTHK